MQTCGDTTYRHVEGLSRGLCILRVLNDTDGRGATPRQISDTTTLNRTTVKRILETLVAEGYVLPCAEDGSYGVAPQVLSLSRGLNVEAYVLHAAGPVLKALGERTRWSLRITTFQDDCMVVRDTTHGRSDLSSVPSVGLRHGLPMLLTSAGRAYFAQCDATKRHRILERVRARKDEQASLAWNDRLVALLSQRVLDDGYAMNDGDWGGRGIGAIALPVRDREGKTLACMSMIYDRRATSQSSVIDEFLPELRNGVNRIEAVV